MKKIAYIFILFAFLGAVPVRADSGSSIAPTINTHKDATGTSIYISFPAGFNGSVSTTYDGNDFKTTYSTSTKQIAEDVAKIHERIIAQQRALDEFFRAQQKMFQQLWGDWWWF